ncbi:MAG: hypothetical protein QM784_25030 [Polyangiaceae bacterium]
MSSLPRKKQAPIVAHCDRFYHASEILEATVGAFLALVALAMAFYPGGTWWDRTTEGHRFGRISCAICSTASACPERPT